MQPGRPVKHAKRAQVMNEVRGGNPQSLKLFTIRVHLRFFRSYNHASEDSIFSRLAYILHRQLAS